MLAEIECVRLNAADHMRVAQDRSKSQAGLAWVASLEYLSFALLLDLFRNKRRAWASVLRLPKERDHDLRAPKVWGQDLQSPGTSSCERHPKVVVRQPLFLIEMYSRL